MAIRSILIHYVSYELRNPTYSPVPSVQNVLLASLNNPKKRHLGIKVAESAISHRIFWLLWKMAYMLTRETEMTVAGMGLALIAAALEIEEEEKKEILLWLCRKRRKAIFIYIQELPQFKLPHTIRTVRIEFTDFLRIDSGRRFVEIRLLLDRGLDATHSDANVSHMYTMLYRGGDFAWARYP